MRLDPAQVYQTYTYRRRSDQLVRAACEEVGCPAWRYGWETKVDEGTDLGRAQAAYIRRRAGRTFTEHRTVEGVTVFRFEARQRCFADHRTLPEAFTVLNGDPAHFGGVRRRHVNGLDWAEDFAAHLDLVNEQRRKG